MRPTSSRHTGVGGIRLYWDSASDGPPSEGGAIPPELLGAVSRTTPLPRSLSSEEVESQLERITQAIGSLHFDLKKQKKQ